MRASFLLLTILLCFNKGFAQEKRDLSRDSSYNNWYYESREKLYQGLKNTKTDIVFFGNSITERGPWQELIAGKHRIGNRGIGGDNTFGMKARVADVVKTKPSKIFLMMGINDIGRGLPTAWSLKNYEEIILTIKKHSPKTKIYVQSTLPMNDELLKYDYLKGKEQLIRDLNAGIQKLATTYNLTYVELSDVLGENGILNKNYTSDGIHINTDGYIHWVDYLKAKKYL
ncbi:GDSL-type esterase/lipase family protein [Sphingobacterium hotanense]|uniref:GDSL-type esterase/lipase family protein n=1 Tax=Sphingobacterium hotanense TaxID=649196 RepID=UPI0021A75A4F|nr:GDSL-type esterase/lipase family protein [Sphingobacterium hotanense]MCT1523029.1 GDSL-type esterase/lipase family protein [Sphingobacterium hotanense]